MVNNLDSENTKNDEFTLNTEDSDFKILITRLQEISKTIDSLEKKYLDKF